VIGLICSGDGLRTHAGIALPRVIGLAFLLGVYGAPAMADSGCTLKEVASLPADFSHGAVMVEVGVNGQKVNFTLDSASNLTQINPALVHRLGLAIVDLHLRTVSDKGTQERQNALVQDFTLGQMVSHANKFYITFDGSDGSDGESAGTLGLDFLGNYDIELDPTEKRVNLFDPIRCERAVYWWDDHFELPIALDRYREPTARIVLDGKEFIAAIDTGVTESRLDIAAAHRQLDVPDTIQAPPTEADDSLNPVYTFKELVFGPITLRHPKLKLQRFKALAVSTGTHIQGSIANDMPIIIDMDILGKFHSMISFGSGKIYFTLPNERKPSQAAPPKS
jgi:hypothetical protein